MPVLLLFFLSGATALIYEVIWSKYLALMFGSTVQAQTAVLAVFMGGLALGNRIFGKRSALLKQPLAAYGYIELVIGLYAFFFHSIYSLADRAFVNIGSNFAENSGALLALKGALAVALLIVPTLLMGGTLPLLAAWLERRTVDAGRGSARFYSTNSLGAVFGSGVAGFYLVREWGMLASLQLAAFANLIIAVAAIAISRNLGDIASPEKTVPSQNILPARTAMGLVAITGGVSMGLEVLCSRAVALIVGGSLQSFAIVLMAFILGIGAGAGVVASPRFARFQTQRTIFILLLAAAGVIALFIIRLNNWAIFYSSARYAIAQNENGYVLHQFVVAVVAILTIGIPACLLGAVLPMAIRSGSATGGSLGDQVGRLLTWNTLGAVAGVLLTGFVLMPMVGLRGSFLILALVLCAIAAIGGWRSGDSSLQFGGLAIVGSIVLMLVVDNPTWRHVLGAGLYRLRGDIRLTHQSIDQRQREVTIHYYKDGADATVAVEESNAPGQLPQRILRINGKADASTRGDIPTQYLLGHLPMLAVPDAKDVFILGYGSGITAGAVLGHPINSLVVAENCGPVIEAAPLFEKWSRSPLKDARTKLRREDARTVLKLSQQKYGVIISEPSNPWVAGIGSVFSREFYELCASRLAPGGVMAQWFHIYEMHDGIVELVIRTFSSVYPHFEIWEPANGDIILIGSLQPWSSTPDLYQKIFDRPAPRADLADIGMTNATAILARQMVSQKTSFAIVGDGPRQSDEFPVLEYAAPEAFFIGKSAQRIFNFDERTRQSTLAPPIKRQMLSAIPDAQLHAVYKEHATGNPELYEYLKWRAVRVPPGQPHPVYDPHPNLPLIFRPTNTYGVIIPLGVSETERQLLEAEAHLLRQQKIPEALATIKQLLTPEAAEPNKSRSWRPIHSAIIATRAALFLGNNEQAAEFLVLGKKFEPENVELLYFERLLARK